MRRRSERKKSTDQSAINSPAPTTTPSTRRSSRRSRKSPTHSPEPSTNVKRGKLNENEGENEVCNTFNRDSSTDREPQEKQPKVRRRKSITPAKDLSTPTKRGKRDLTKETIPEEINGENELKMSAVENISNAQPRDIVENLKNSDQVISEEISENRGGPVPVPVIEEHPDKNSRIKEKDIEVDEDVENEKKAKENTPQEIVTSKDDYCNKISFSENLENNSEPLNVEENNGLSTEASMHVETDEEINKKKLNSTETLLKSENSEKTTSKSPEKNPSKKHNRKPDMNPISKDDQKVCSEKEDVAEKSIDIETIEHLDHLESCEKPSPNKECRKERHCVPKDTVNTSSEGKENNIKAVETNDKADKSKLVKKRKWLSRKASESKPQVLAISTDSLKNLISDVHPVPLSDINLDSSPDVEVVTEMEVNEEEAVLKETQRQRENREQELNIQEEKSTISKTRKISVSKDEGNLQGPPSPPKNHSSSILYITNLVRPFTILQLKGLLARTGKITENGFWIDRIKSKCYVRFETEDEASETRHALHGVRWPSSNPKCLNVDFGIESDMEKAIASTSDDAGRFGSDANKDNRIVGTGWDRERYNFDEKKEVSRPVREWDMGKKEELEKNSRDKDPRDHDVDRRRDRDRRHQSNEPEKGRSCSGSPTRKKKKECDPPLRLLDDLFRKTKHTPCIYWLPLTPEQIAEKAETRRKRIQEAEEARKERERQREREREKEREKDRHRERERSSDRRRSRSRDRRRY